MQWCAICIFLFLKSDHFIKWIVHIYIVFFKKLKPLFSYLSYYLVEKSITFNRTDVSQVNEEAWKKNFPNFLYTLHKAKKSQSHHFAIHS